MPDGTERILGKLEQGFSDLAEKVADLKEQNAIEHAEGKAEIKEVKNELVSLRYRIENIEKALISSSEKLSFSISGNSKIGQAIVRGLVIALTALYGDFVTGAHGHKFVGSLFSNDSRTNQSGISERPDRKGYGEGDQIRPSSHPETRGSRR